MKFPKGDLHPDKPIPREFDTEAEANKAVRDFVKKRKQLGELGNLLSTEGAADAVKALRLLPNGVSLEKAAMFTAQQMARAEKSTTFITAYQDFLIWLKEHDRSKRHISDHKHTLKTFNSLWNRNLTSITRLDVEEVLKNRPIYFKNIKVRHLRKMFNFCITNDLLDINPVKKIEQIPTPKSKKQKIRIFSNSDVRKLMQAAKDHSPEILPYLAIAFFAGTRPEEITRLQWDDINNNGITIEAWVNKTLEERYTKMNDTLKAWLDWHKNSGGASEGKIFRKSTKTLERTRRKVSKIAGVQWIQDGARKTFASAHFQIFGEEQTIKEMGHKGSRMLYKHYKKNLKQSEAEDFWKILPSD